MYHSGLDIQTSDPSKSKIFTSWNGHNSLTDNTLKKITQDVMVRCLVIMSYHNAKLARHFQNLVGQCAVSDCCFQH